MRFENLRFEPHRHANRFPGKTHARAVLANGARISVVRTPNDPLGPNDEPYEVLTSALEGEDGDGIFHCRTPDDVQDVMDRSAAVDGEIENEKGATG